jgi:hypothetical protein
MHWLYRHFFTLVSLVEDNRSTNHPLRAMGICAVPTAQGKANCGISQLQEEQFWMVTDEDHPSLGKGQASSLAK